MSAATDEEAARTLFRIDGGRRRLAVQEVAAAEARGNLHELARLLREVERVDDARRARIGASEAAEVEVVFDEAQDTSELIRRVRDVAALTARADDGVWRDHEHRHAKAETTPLIGDRRRDVVVETSPVVPDDDDC